ncbi:MAG: hypothetical protein HPY78_09340 [Brevinematales bacterium]|nr:hypothetical protein [Brevinematales bacterium]
MASARRHRRQGREGLWRQLSKKGAFCETAGRPAITLSQPKAMVKRLTSLYPPPHGYRYHPVSANHPAG